MLLEVTVPSPGESVSEAMIETWLKKDGDIVRRDEELAYIQSDKATLTVYSEAAGKIHILVGEGQTVTIGQVICKIDTSVTDGAAAVVTSAGNGSTATQPAVVAPKLAETANYATGTPSPSAARMLAEKGLSPSDVVGTGRDGRITKADALTAPTPVKTVVASPVSPVQPVAPELPTGTRTQRRVRMTPLRKTLAKRLVSVKNETAMLTTFNEVDMSAIMNLRKKYKEPFEKKHGIGLGFMSFFSKACAEALKAFPQVNAIIDGDDIVFNDYVDLGVAVSTDKGLMVPIIRGADTMNLAAIERNLAELAAKARKGEISVADMTGGTFTITNGGVFGSLLSTPILNPPQSAILGMHKIQERPVAVDGQVVVRPMMYLALSYDHRIIDGKESVSFLVRVKELLEDPMRLLLEV